MYRKMLWIIVLVWLVYKLTSWALARVRIGHYVNKHVLITGCDSGFGFLLARRLDGLGFRVFASCLTSTGAKKLQETCSERVITFPLDVTDEQSISAARSFVDKNLPPGRGLWGVVNNAGICGASGPSEWMSRSDYISCLSVNLFGLIDVTRTFLPLVRLEKGRVVNVASIMGRIAVAPAPYCISKHGVEAYSDCLRREVYNQGIKVCIIEPGFFKTDILSLTPQFNSFKKTYEATPPEIRAHYPHRTLETFPKLNELFRNDCSEKLDLVIDALELTLTSRFPPTRQLVGLDAKFPFRLLWNLPTPLTDWLLHRWLSSKMESLTHS